jgi:hypothetical protein
MKNSVYWDVSPCVSSSPILVTPIMEATSSSESSVLTRATWRNIPEDGILQSHCRENLKSYIIILSFVTADGYLVPGPQGTIGIILT